MRKMNEYFFGEAEICLSDALYFYGLLGGSTILALAVALPILL